MEDQKTPTTLSNFIVICESKEKLSQLIHFIREHKQLKLMIYFLTCACVDYFERLLPMLPQLKDVPIWALHGKMVQKKRSGIYDKFINVSGISGFSFVLHNFAFAVFKQLQFFFFSPCFPLGDVFRHQTACYCALMLPREDWIFRMSILLCSLIRHKTQTFLCIVSAALREWEGWDVR
jgi:hypothetical protein